MRFVIRLKDGESMVSLCREFGIYRQTGYKIIERYEECGWRSERSRSPIDPVRQLVARDGRKRLVAKRGVSQRIMGAEVATCDSCRTGVR